MYYIWLQQFSVSHAQRYGRHTFGEDMGRWIALLSGIQCYNMNLNTRVKKPILINDSANVCTKNNKITSIVETLAKNGQSLFFV